MSIVFDSLNTRNLDTVYEINFNQYLQHLVTGKIPNNMVEDAPFAVRIASGIRAPHHNAIIQTDITDNFEEIYENTVAFFSEHNLPYTWYIGPHTTPDNLQQQLESKGFRYIGDDAIVGVEIESMIRNISTPNSLYIEAIHNQDQLHTWIDLYCKVRNIRGQDVDKYKQIFQDMDLSQSNLPWKKYIGWLNGKPVACSTLVMAGGIAVVYDGTVLPNYKNWGIENSINLIPLRKALKSGFYVGMIPLPIGSIKQYTGIGFKELFKFKKLVYVERRRRRR